jgi:hypothetical protein
MRQGIWYSDSQQKYEWEVADVSLFCLTSFSLKDISWDHFPSEPLELNALPQGLLLGELKLRP